MGRIVLGIIVKIMRDNDDSIMRRCMTELSNHHGTHAKTRERAHAVRLAGAH